MVACKSHILKFPMRIWQEACHSDTIHLSTRTFEHQMQALGISQPQLNLGAAGMAIDVKDCGRQDLTATQAEAASQKAHTDVCSVSASQKYIAANTAVFLPNFELLSYSDPHFLLKLAMKSKLRAFEPCTVILTQGCSWPSVDGSPVAYLILSGQLLQHAKPAGGEVDADKWHAFQQLLQAQALSGPGTDYETNLDVPETSDTFPKHFDDMRGKDAWALVTDCFGPLVDRMRHGSIVGESLLLGKDAKSLATYITGTRVWALEINVQDFIKLDAEENGVVSRPHLAASILRRDPSSRDERDLEIVSGCIHKVPFFEMFPDKALLELCRMATLRSLTPGQMLFEHGDEADEIFVVLSGTFGVHAMPSKLTETEDQEREKEAEEAVSAPLHAFRPRETVASKAAPGGKSRSDAVIVGPCTGVRTTGQSIGQAIVYSSSAQPTRKTSVKARGKAAVMVIKLPHLLPYQSFLNARAFFEPAKMMQVLFQPSLRSDDDLLAIGEFVRSLPLLSSIDAADLSALAKHVKAEKKPPGTVLYRRQERLSALYFLVQGTAAICSPDPSLDVNMIREHNAQRFEAGHVFVNDTEVQQVSMYGAIDHFARDGDSLIQEVTGRGRDALARLPQNNTKFTHSCITVKPSIIASLNFKAIAECLAEWKKIQSEEALMVLSKTYPFSSWKQKEVAVLAGLAQRLEYQRGSHIFEQASVADRIFFVQKGEVSLVQKAMSHLVPATPGEADAFLFRLQHAEKGQISADSRRADVAIATVSNGGVLGVDLVNQLNVEKGKAVASKLAETEAHLAQAQKELKKGLLENMSRSFLTGIQTRINALTRQRNDLFSQQHKINTEGVLRHKYRAVVASSVVKLIALRRADIDSIGPRGSTTQIDKHHHHVTYHRAGNRSDLGSKHEKMLQGLGGGDGASAALFDEVEGAQSAILERRRFVGDVRVVAALSGQRGGLLLNEESSVSPQAALSSLMNLRKWLRKKYGKLGSAVTILSCFHGGQVIPNSALKALCDESACGLKPEQLSTAIACSNSSHARGDSKDKITYLPVPRSGSIERGQQVHDDGMNDGNPRAGDVIFFSDLKKMLDNEETLIDAAMRVANRSSTPGEIAGAERPPANGTFADVSLPSTLPEEDTSRPDVTSDALESSFSSEQKAGEEDSLRGFDERAGRQDRATLAEKGRPKSAMTTRDRSRDLHRGRPSSAAESRDVRPNKFTLVPGAAENNLYILQEVQGDLSQESQSPRRQTASAARIDFERPASAISSKSEGHGRRTGPFHSFSGRTPRPKTAFTRRSEWAAGLAGDFDASDGDLQVFFLVIVCLHSGFSDALAYRELRGILDVFVYDERARACYKTSILLQGVIAGKQCLRMSIP